MDTFELMIKARKYERWARVIGLAGLILLLLIVGYGLIVMAGGSIYDGDEDLYIIGTLGISIFLEIRAISLLSRAEIMNSERRMRLSQA